MVTGGRDWTDAGLISVTLLSVEHMARPQYRAAMVLVHGSCEGADLIAASIAEHAGWKVEAHPAAWRRSDGSRDRAAGRRRNAEMVATLGPDDVVLAFPTANSRGTWHAVALAKAAGVKVVITWPKGQTKL